MSNTWDEAERASEARIGGAIYRKTLDAGYVPRRAATAYFASTFAKSGVGIEFYWLPRDTAGRFYLTDENAPKELAL